MSGARPARGFTLIEMLIAMALVVAVGTALAAMVLQSSALNRSQQMTVNVQSDARSCLALVVAKLRSAGWDPLRKSLPTIQLDPDLSDAVSQVEVFADLNADGDVLDAMESLLIRHANGRVEWRPTSITTAPFEVVAVNVTNDADGDGTVEPMFQPLPVGAAVPTSIRVQVTAESPMPDPVSGQPIRYTVRSDVVLRKNL